MKTSVEQLSSLHMQMVQKVTDLVKEVNKYADDLHKKHKMVRFLFFPREKLNNTAVTTDSQPLQGRRLSVFLDSYLISEKIVDSVYILKSTNEANRDDKSPKKTRKTYQNRPKKNFLYAEN